MCFHPAGRGLKKPKQPDCERLQKAAIQLLEQQQNLCGLLREVGVSMNPDQCKAQNQKHDTLTRSILIYLLKIKESLLLHDWVNILYFSLLRFYCIPLHLLDLPVGFKIEFMHVSHFPQTLCRLQISPTFFTLKIKD